MFLESENNVSNNRYALVNIMRKGVPLWCSTTPTMESTAPFVSHRISAPLQSVMRTHGACCGVYALYSYISIRFINHSINRPSSASEKKVYFIPQTTASRQIQTSSVCFIKLCALVLWWVILWFPFLKMPFYRMLLKQTEASAVKGDIAAWIYKQAKLWS